MRTCQTYFISHRGLLFGTSDTMLTEAISSAGKSNQKPHVNYAVSITG